MFRRSSDSPNIKLGKFFHYSMLACWIMDGPVPRLPMLAAEKDVVYCVQSHVLCVVDGKVREGRTMYITVEPPIMDPPTRGQPLYKGHGLWHQLKLL